MAILLKIASVWVSSIQIIQVRVQNKGKSVWKSRYDGDVSPTYMRYSFAVLSKFVCAIFNLQNKFPLFLSVCKLNCLRTSKGLSLGSWYVSVVSNFPNTFALVLDSNLYDLNGTNPDWRCFQRNCHDVVLCAENKSTQNDLRLHGIS